MNSEDTTQPETTSSPSPPISKKKQELILNVVKSIYTLKQRNRKKKRANLSRKVRHLLKKHHSYKIKCLDD
jgi:hypothetical protein